MLGKYLKILDCIFIPLRVPQWAYFAITSLHLIHHLSLKIHAAGRAQHRTEHVIDSVFLHEYVNETSINPLWWWRPTVTPPTNPLRLTSGERYKYNPLQGCSDDRKSKLSAIRDVGGEWRLGPHCVWQVMHHYSNDKTANLQSFMCIRKFHTSNCDLDWERN
jgi:hypothetical protein